MFVATVLIAIMFAHLLADFYFQTREMAEGKSSSLRILFSHALTYTYVMAVALVAMFSLALTVFDANISILLLPLLVPYAILNGVIHLVVDFFTSKISSIYYHNGNMKGFWLTIGTDQFIHTASLIATAAIIFL
jgi:hypothetical protein